MEAYSAAGIKVDAAIAQILKNLEIAFKMVGVAGFEPATPRPPGVCATGLRHTPPSILSSGL